MVISSGDICPPLCRPFIVFVVSRREHENRRSDVERFKQLRGLLLIQRLLPAFAEAFSICLYYLPARRESRRFNIHCSISSGTCFACFLRRRLEGLYPMDERSEC